MSVDSSNNAEVLPLQLPIDDPWTSKPHVFPILDHEVHVHGVHGKSTPLQMPALLVIAEVTQEGAQRFIFTVNVPHDVQGTFRQALNQTH